MAGDLIPPPSPAGRPPPDPPSEPRRDRAPRGGDAARRGGGSRPAPAGAVPRRASASSFGALAGSRVCAAALGVVLIAAPGGDGPQLAENWSSWEPSTSNMVDGAAEIAAHVGLPVPARRRRPARADPQLGRSSCRARRSASPCARRAASCASSRATGCCTRSNGLGQNGTLPGKASEARGRLLRREALELALYSFRYLDDVTMVVVLLPPVGASTVAGRRATAPTQTQAVFYRPGDLLSRLQVPLAQTISGSRRAEEAERGRGQADRRPDAAQPLPRLGAAAEGRPELPRAGRARSVS